MTSIVARGVFTVSLAFDRNAIPGLADSDGADHPIWRRHCGVVAL